MIAPDQIFLLGQHMFQYQEDNLKFQTLARWEGHNSECQTSLRLILFSMLKIHPCVEI